MDPIAILRSIVQIAQAIHTQVNLAKSNQEKLRTLAITMQRIVSSLEGLSTLPRQQQFIDSLTALETCLKDAEQFTLKMTQITWMDGFAHAGKYEGKINGFKQRIVELVPFLNLGLAAQQLIDREKDRRDEAADHAYFQQQQEAYLRKIQAEAALKPAELEAIVRKQLASFQCRFEKNYRPALSPEPSILPDELIVNLYDVVFKRKIGNSRLGELHQGNWRGQPVTIKWVDGLVTDVDRQQFIREAQVMSRLRHPSIVPFYGACFERDRLCLLMASMEKGNLQTLLPTLTLSERIGMAESLAYGLAYLHDQGMVHGDIALRHIGVNQYNQAQWTEFGWVKTRALGIASVNPRMTNPQEACWQAPEQGLHRQGLSPAGDMYSFGLLLWTLMTERLPYADLEAMDVKRQVQRGFREPIPDRVPPALKALIQACWSADAISRPHAIEVAHTLKALTLAPVVSPRASSPTGDELYERGVDAEKAGNLEEARRLHERASLKGALKSCTSLGFFALQGLGGEAMNKKKAQALFERAAASGHSRAMFNLGRMHEKGDTESQLCDAMTALSWYEKAHQADPSQRSYREKVDTLSMRLHSK